MIDAKGIVTSVEGDYAIVQMDEAGCGRCHEDGGCGGHNLGKMLCSTPKTFRVLNSGNASAGDHIAVSIDAGAIRQSALLAYGLPLLCLFVGAFSGLFFLGETGAIGGSIVGLVGAWGGLRYTQQRKTASLHAQPHIKY
ncbi:MAG: SoxR reducing system RseC family protein [Betaproteobacteria bacterium]